LNFFFVLFNKFCYVVCVLMHAAFLSVRRFVDIKENLLSRFSQSSLTSASLFCCSAIACSFVSVPHISSSFSLYLRFILTSLRPMQVERLLVTYRRSVRNCADQILGSNADMKTNLECSRC
jgi:hypothetical protein